ncbi:hypothetical protein AAVH_05745 [Aphelenchoides avenae]|nr:hypothetical protein AAVH_05745 [Aphelenchus avenae]
MTDSTTQQGDTTADFDVSRPNFNSTAFADNDEEAPKTPDGYSVSAKRSVFRGPKASPILRNREGTPGELARRRLMHHAESPIYSPNKTCDMSLEDPSLQPSVVEAKGSSSATANTHQDSAESGYHTRETPDSTRNKENETVSTDIVSVDNLFATPDRTKDSQFSRTNPFESAWLANIGSFSMSPSALMVSRRRTTSGSSSTVRVHRFLQGRSLCLQVSTPGSFRWNIEHKALLNPVHIDESELHLQDTSPHSDEEEPYKARLAAYWAQPHILPSPDLFQNASARASLPNGVRVSPASSSSSSNESSSSRKLRPSKHRHEPMTPIVTMPSRSVVKRVVCFRRDSASAAAQAPQPSLSPSDPEAQPGNMLSCEEKEDNASEAALEVDSSTASQGHQLLAGSEEAAGAEVEPTADHDGSGSAEQAADLELSFDDEEDFGTPSFRVELDFDAVEQSSHTFFQLDVSPIRSND